MAREQFSSRLGFLLIAAGCSIGLGNVWRFPYITGEYGGAIFLVNLFIFPSFWSAYRFLTIELAVGRASRRSLGKSFEEISPNTKVEFKQVPDDFGKLCFDGLLQLGYRLDVLLHDQRWAAVLIPVLSPVMKPAAYSAACLPILRRSLYAL